MAAVGRARLTVAHVPHVYVPPPWPPGDLPLPADALRHLQRVLRRAPNTPVSYTDGAGTVGDGSLGAATIVRGHEEVVTRGRLLTCAVAPPRRTDRARFLVEKLAELGVDRLVWLRTRHTQASPPRGEKARAWAVSALEQSRGAHLMEICGPLGLTELGDAATLVVTAAGGGSADAALPAESDLTIVVGPEGGLADAEIPCGAVRLGLGARILRTETAAVVAAGLALDRRRRRT